MYLSEFWSKLGTDIVISSLFILASISLLVILIINLTKQKTGKRLYLIGGTIFALVLISINFVFVRDYLIALKRDLNIIFPLTKVLLFNAFIITLFVVGGYLFFINKDKKQEKMTVATIAILGLLTSISTVLMFFGIPIFPTFVFLKVEVSALIYFIIFLWFGIKPAVLVIFATNIIHAIMPPITPKIIPGLDEFVNVIAVFAFLMPSFIAYRKLNNESSPEFGKVVITSIIGAVFTTIFMTLYNHYINLPIIFGMDMDFIDVLLVFGIFNFVKWSTVAVSIIFSYRKLFDLKDKIVRS